MKKWFRLFSVFFALIVSVTIFSACTFKKDLNVGDVAPPKEIIIPTEIRVSGYINEIVVGDSYINNLKVEQKLDGTWYQVPKADYQVVCNYDGYKYGEFAFNVYLNEYAGVSFTDTIKVSPKTVDVPSSYAVSYTGEVVDIKAYFESISQGLYTVDSYANRSDIGDYQVELLLNNTEEYVWKSTSGDLLKTSKIIVNWSITE